ncbi:expressed unknown protein [Seminavis robusta]|uniref:EF-hand domain-containing protein n=1 Tax=Seminavis robusta TaxID=568900 RepID=A0A9N8HLS6_9STRA|nr:expressed unknown protein [Seminavis robusta]|eukprot:Sro1056_g236150.1 n/a (91) ;mRNA; r:10807-11079
MKFFVLLAILLGGFRRLHTGVQKQEQKKLDRFFECLDSMEIADADGNNRLSEIEAHLFIGKYSVELYGESILVGDTLPATMASLYSDLVF